MWENFGSILAILFIICYTCNLAGNLAEFRKCLAEYNVHNLVTLLGLT